MDRMELMPQWAKRRAPHWINDNECPVCNGSNYKIDVIECNEFLKTVEARALCGDCGHKENIYISECWTEWETCPRCNKKSNVAENSISGGENIVLAMSFISRCSYCGFEESFGY
jgi:transcription elongation factor Elf1